MNRLQLPRLTAPRACALIRVDGPSNSTRYLNTFLDDCSLSKHSVDAEIPQTYHIENVATLTI
jgi:hypothetical protein